MQYRVSDQLSGRTLVESYLECFPSFWRLQSASCQIALCTRHKSDVSDRNLTEILLISAGYPAPTQPTYHGPCDHAALSVNIHVVGKYTILYTYITYVQKNTARSWRVFDPCQCAQRFLKSLSGSPTFLILQVLK